MTDEHKAAFRRLLVLTPTNIHLLTEGLQYSWRLDFESLWSRHGPTAARYFLFPKLWYGQLHIKDEQNDAGQSELRESSAEVRTEEAA